jgi:hypothetical protein
MAVVRKIFFSLRFDGYKQRTIEATHARVGSQTDHNHGTGFESRQL